MEQTKPLIDNVPVDPPAFPQRARVSIQIKKLFDLCHCRVVVLIVVFIFAGLWCVVGIGHGHTELGIVQTSGRRGDR